MKTEKVLEKPKPVVTHIKREEKVISEAVKRRENTVIALLLMGDFNIFEILRQNIKVEDFQDEVNKKIAQKLYEEFEKGNSNINAIIDNLEQDEQNQITMIMSEDYEITDIEKAIDDVVQAYEREKLNTRKFEILDLLDKNLENDQKKELEKELSNIIIRLAKIK